jgi:hypothetical protein
MWTPLGQSVGSDVAPLTRAILADLDVVVRSSDSLVIDKTHTLAQRGGQLARLDTYRVRHRDGEVPVAL